MKANVANFMLLWISARLDNKLNLSLDIIALNQPNTYINYINLVLF